MELQAFIFNYLTENMMIRQLRGKNVTEISKIREKIHYKREMNIKVDVF